MSDRSDVKGKPSVAPVEPAKRSRAQPKPTRQAYQAVAYEIAELIGGACAVHLLSEGAEQLVPVAWHHSGDYLDGAPSLEKPEKRRPAPECIRVGEGVVGGVAASGRSKRKAMLTRKEARALPYDASRLARLAPSGKLSLVCVPIREDGATIGTCSVVKEHLGRPYAKEDQALVHALLGRATQVKEVYERREGAERAQAGRALRVSEQDFLSKAVESASDAIYITDADGRSIYQNQAFLDLIGYTTGEINEIGGPSAMFSRPEVARDAFATVQQGRSWSGEVELQGQDGRAVPIFMRADAVRDHEGRVAGLMGICTDITERKLAQEVVKESVELFQATFEQAAVGVAQVALDGRILQANEKLCHILGYECEELIGMKMQALELPTASAERAPDLARFYAGEANTYTREKQVVRKDGSPVWINEVASWVRDGAQRPKYLIAIIQDVSDRKRSENALQESEKRLSLMLQQTPAIIWSADEEMRLTRLIGAGLQARPVTQPETPGVPAALVHARAPEALPFDVPREPQQRALGGESVEFEIEADDRVYQSRVEPFRDADGTVKGVVGVATDVTERRRMHDALLQSEERYRSFVSTITEAIWCYELDASLPVNLSIALQVRHIYQTARMVECNEVYAREMVGRPLGEVKGRRICELFELLPERFQFLSDFIRSGYRIENKRYSDIDARGKRRYYVANVVGIQENNRLVRIWGSRIDATETVDMEREMLNALEHQQQRIGHDLHDGVGQLLTAVRMLSEQLADELDARDARQAGLAGKIASFAQDALQQTRQVYRGLSPVMLQTEGLLTTLRDLAHNLDVLPDVTCTFTCNTEAEPGDPDTWIHMYRIMQEGAHNAVKHGHCENLWLVLTVQKNKIVLSIRDDGQGFDPDRVRGGIGLSGMRHRAQLIGAVLEIESDPGEGTTLTCTIPLEGSRGPSLAQCR